MNTELFKMIDAIINQGGEPNLKTFGMQFWEEERFERGESCGTTRCLSGWAIHLTTGKPLFGDIDTLEPSVEALARERGLTSDGVFETLRDLGAELLGLSAKESEIFFSSNEDASRFAYLAARGKEDEARALL